MQADGQWVAIDTSVSGELRFALVRPGAPPRLDRTHVYRTDMLPTFTDGLLRFANDAGINLREADAAIAVAGAVSDTAIPIARSRWTISREGLAVLFRRPPLLLNDVAARAWAVRATPPAGAPIRGVGTADLTRPGRLAMLMVDDGVGCAIIDIDQEGVARIVESEGGHGDFAPADAMQDRLAAALRGGTNAVPSWEQVLTLERGDAPLAAALGPQGDRDRQRLMGLLLGRFVAHMIVTAGAWHGALLSGRRPQRLLAGDGRAGFDAAFTQRRTFRRLIEGAPCWQVNQNEPVLTGAAMMLSEHHRLHGSGATIRP